MFKKKIQQAVGIDIGYCSIKIVGLYLTGTAKLVFHSVIRVPEKPDPAFISDAVMRVLKEHDATHANVYITISDESANIRTVELPVMPDYEMLEALKWQARDRVPFDIDKAVLDFRTVREVPKADGSKVADVMFVAALKGAIEKKIELFRKLGLNIVSVNVSSFSLENILRAKGDIDASRTLLLIDIGHSKTDISFYKNKTLQFIRTIPIASDDITVALKGPLVVGMEKREFTAEEAEDIKRQVGIAYEPLRLDRGITSIQVLTMMRGTLERFSKEIKRSIEYYTSEVSGEPVTEVYLVGGGSGLKNMDKYLGEELNLPVRNMEIPKEIDVKGLAVSAEEARTLMSAIGAALDLSKKVNLLPQEYRVKKAEFIEKVSVRLISFIVVTLLVFSYFIVKLKVDDYARRVQNATLHKSILSQVKALNEKIGERDRLVEAINKGELDIEYLMKSLSNIIPSTVVISSLKIDPRSKSMDLAGSVGGKSGEAEALLTGFMEDMERSPCFKDAQLSSVQDQSSTSGASSLFSINCQLE